MKVNMIIEINKLKEIAITLRELSFSEDISYEKSQELRRQKEEIEKKYMFYKQLYERMNGGKSNESSIRRCK